MCVSKVQEQLWQIPRLVALGAGVDAQGGYGPQGPEGDLTYSQIVFYAS